MKKSIYNWIYKRGSDEIVIYNTYSKAIVSLNEEEFSKYERDALPMDTALELKENGIYVEDDFDELHFLKYMHYKAKFSKRIFRLTIAPTLDCNFDCPYCYENRRNGKMSEEVQDALIDFIQNNVTSETSVMDISWYGGEPLLYPDIVENLGKRIRDIAEKKDIICKMHMVTNGYLLTEKIISMLDNIGVTRIQITLDGMDKNHNMRRPLRNGKGTFDRIYENLMLFEESPIVVNVRMNIDNENKRDYLTLKEKIRNLHNNNIKIYPSPVEDINKEKVNNISKFMSAQEFDEFTINECGTDFSSDDSIMDDRCCFCHAEMEMSYVVDELGNLFKCWDEVGREEYICANVLNGNDVKYEHLLHYLVEKIVF